MMEYINNIIKNNTESNICFSLKNKYTANYIDVRIENKIFFSIEYFVDIEAGGISLRNDNKTKYYNGDEILDFLDRKQDSIELFPSIFIRRESTNVAFVYEKNDFFIEYFFDFNQKEKDEFLNLIVKLNNQLCNYL